MRRRRTLRKPPLWTNWNGWSASGSTKGKTPTSPLPVHGRRTASSSPDTTVAQLRTQLKSAELNLQYTTVRAPSDGYAIGLSLRPGQRVAQFPVRGWMTYVETSGTRVAVAINQCGLRHVKPGQRAEVALQLYPGRTFPATVKSIAYITPAGQLQPSGVVPTAPAPQHQRLPYAVVILVHEHVTNGRKSCLTLNWSKCGVADWFYVSLPHGIPALGFQEGAQRQDMLSCCSIPTHAGAAKAVLDNRLTC